VKVTQRISGSTKIVELIVMYPNGRAVELMARLGWPCGQCGARQNEPLSLAAKRHGNPVHPTIACFRALEGDGPTTDELAAALPRPRRRADPLVAWKASARRSAGLP
jgi:hypothetical protein